MFSNTIWQNLSPIGINCYHGVVLTPTEIYAVRTIFPSPEHPLGIVKTVITPENYQVPAAVLSPNNAPDSFTVSNELYLDTYTRFVDGAIVFTGEDDHIRPNFDLWHLKDFIFMLGLETPESLPWIIETLENGVADCLGYYEEEGLELNANEKIVLERRQELIERARQAISEQNQ